VRADPGATWYAARAAGAFERPRLTYDLDVDVCVIGGGLAGLTVAREIARRGWSVAVLEAQRVAWNASGRNCGFVVPGFGADVRRMVERVGLDRAKALWALAEMGVDYVRTTIRDTAMPGVAPVAGWLDVSKVDNGDELLAVATLLGQDFGAEIEGWPTERVRAALRSDFYFHAIHYPTAFHIDPLAYAHGLANAALAAGATIFEETPALAIDPAGVRKRVTTPKGRVRAPHVVLAGNAHLGALAPGLAETVLPVMGYVAVSAPLGERLGEAIAYQGAVSDTRLSDFHYRIVDGDRLMWAGGAGVGPPGPGRAVKRFKAAIARIFPQLGAVEFEHAWAGVMGFSVHRVPQVGEVVPGLWLASAFGAHGLNTTAMAGELIASAITERDDRWRLFLPYELVWAGGMLGRAVRHVGAWSLRAGEDFAASLARRREAVRRAEAQADGAPAEPARSELRSAPLGSAPSEPQVDGEAVDLTVADAEAGEVATAPAAAADVVAADVAVDPSALVPEVESLLRQMARHAEGGPAEETDAQMQHSPEKSPDEAARSEGQVTEKPAFSDKTRGSG
jgi:glycine/D-amino acid oxidase-like deaminating enzyme